MHVECSQTLVCLKFEQAQVLLFAARYLSLSSVRVAGALPFTLYSWMTPFCMWLGGGSHETLMLELLLGFTAVTVTALGGALGTEGTQRSQDTETYELKAAPRKTRIKENEKKP